MIENTGCAGGVRLDPRLRGDKGVKIFEKIWILFQNTCAYD